MLQMIKPMKPSSNLEQFKKKHNECYWSVKLDGVRVLCHVNRFTIEDSAHYEISWYSGNGKLLPNFHTLNDQVYKYLAPLDFSEIVLDGEMCAKGFSEIMTQLRRLKDIDPSIFKYYVFDIANRDDVILTERLNTLNTFIQQPQICTVIHTWSRTSEIEDVAKIKINLDHEEGIIAKVPDSFYEQKRSLNWVKIKKEETLDVVVTEITEGTGKHKGRLGALVCKTQDGLRFNVGTGFSDAERKKFYDNEFWEFYNGDEPLVIEISCMELTSKGVPRHPVFIRVREDK